MRFGETIAAVETYTVDNGANHEMIKHERVEDYAKSWTMKLDLRSYTLR